MPPIDSFRNTGKVWSDLGYTVVHLDAPGTGLSPGTVDVWSKRDILYYYDAIEWVAKQPWCDGQVGRKTHQCQGTSPLCP